MGFRKVRVELSELSVLLEHGGMVAVDGQKPSCIADVFRDEIDRVRNSCTIVFESSEWRLPFGYNDIPFAELEVE